MEEPIIEKHTTYVDSKRRSWVVETLWYTNEENPEEITHVSIYLVRSYQQYKYLAIADFKEFITNKQFVLVQDHKI